ncbi:MAG: MMPL family transporter, partial [Thermoguttaceae bacterium]
MFDRLGAFVARHWLLVLLTWAALVGGIRLVAPHWDEITHDGDFAYLPDDMTSVAGQKLLNSAFPEILSKSQVVLVVSRADGELQGADFALAQRLVDQFTPLEGEGSGDSPIVDVQSYETPVIGKKLISRPGSKGQALLIALMLRNEFMAIDNWDLMTGLYEQLDAIRAEDDFPEGLRLDVTGSAAVGFDMLHSAGESIRNTELTTIVLVVLILLLVYRAPGLVIVPLTTIIVSVVVAMDLVAIVTDVSARTGWYDFKVFKTSKIFIVVILFGAGTDYCLFLISRYREELRHGLQTSRALAVALGQVGNALAASALTTVFGLGMMAFADFGKFSYSGPAIALCLVVALAACMTLAPALLRAGGRAVFWPFGVGTPLGANEPAGSGVFTGFWHRLSRVVIARPGLILVGSVLLMAPLVCVGWSVPITYDLLSEMQADKPSVQGVRQLGQHFVTAEIDPITLLVHDPDGRIFALEDEDKLTKEGRRNIALLTKALYELEYVDSNGQRIKPITSVRSLTEPLGNPPGSFNPFSAAGRDKLM